MSLALSDITSLGILRVEQIFGDGGTGNLTLTGNGCFYPIADKKVALFQIGQHAPEWFPSGWPIIEWEIDTTVVPGKDMGTAPRMKFKRTVGDFFNNHIIAASGGQSNWITGGFAPVERLTNGKLRFRWTYSDGYTGGIGYPQYGMTDLNYETGEFTSYGPWKIDVRGHRHISSQIIKLPPWFVSLYCPGFSYAAIGQQGSGNGGSPFGSSLIAIEDFDPVTKPPATNATDLPTVGSKYLIHHSLDHKMKRPMNYGVCRWNGDGTTTGKYDCRLGATISPGLPLFGGTPNGGSDGTEENDTQVGVCWPELPDKDDIMFFYKMTETPAGLSIPSGLVHSGYASALHGTESGSLYPNQGCCHAVEGQGQFDPDWRSTGPFSNFHMPCVSIYSKQELIDVADNKKQLWECIPTVELKDWREVDPLFAVHPPKTATDYQGVIFLSGTSWVDTRDRRLYILSAYDFATDANAARLPHLSVYEIKAGTTPEPPIPPVEPIVRPRTSEVRMMSGRGSPEGRVRAEVGTLYIREDGGENTTLYVKEFNSGKIGWRAK